MIFKKTLLWLNILIFLFFGLGYLFSPSFFASLVDLELSTPNAISDFRAIGGMITTISFWYIYCVTNESRIDTGILSAFIILMGMFAGRLIGIILSGSPNGISLFYVTAEGITLLLLAVAIKKQTFKKRPDI